MSSAQPPDSNGSPPSTSVLSGIAQGVGLGSPQQGAPQVTPPNQANFAAPNSSQIQQALQTLQQANVTVDQTQLNAVTGQQQQLAGQELGQLQSGKGGPGGSAAEMGTETALQEGAAEAQGAAQGLGRAVNPAQALRQEQGAQAAGGAKAVAAGAQARAGEEQQLVNQAQNALSSAAQGTLAGASQRLQAEVAQGNLRQQAVQMQMQQAMQQLRAQESYAQLSQRVAAQNRQDYLNSAVQAQRNMSTLVGSILQAGGALGAAYLSAPSGATPAGGQMVAPGTPLQELSGGEQAQIVGEQQGLGPGTAATGTEGATEVTGTRVADEGVFT